MSETTYWNALTPEQRNELIVEKVFEYNLSQVKGYFAIPDYSRDMSAAWLIVEEMKKGEWSNFCYELDGVLTQHKRGWDESTEKPYVTWFEQFMKSLNAEGICIAALRTCDVVIEQETKE